MFRRLVVEEEPKVPVVHFSVHDHGLKDGPFANDELDHAVDEAQLTPVDGDHDGHRGLVGQLVVPLLFFLVLQIYNI